MISQDFCPITASGVPAPGAVFILSLGKNVICDTICAESLLCKGAFNLLRRPRIFLDVSCGAYRLSPLSLPVSVVLGEYCC